MKACTSSEFYSGHFGFLTFIRVFLSLACLILLRALHFGVDFFTHRHFLPCPPCLHFATFVTQMQAGIPHSGSSTKPIVIDLSLPASAWPWAADVVVTTLLSYHTLMNDKVESKIWSNKYILDWLMLIQSRIQRAQKTLNKARWDILLIIAYWKTYTCVILKLFITAFHKVILKPIY